MLPKTKQARIEYLSKLHKQGKLTSEFIIDLHRDENPDAELDLATVKLTDKELKFLTSRTDV